MNASDMRLTTGDLHASCDHRITAANHRRLGYDRLTWGVYGHWPSTDGSSTTKSLRDRLLTHVRAVMAAYPSMTTVLYGPTAFHLMGVALPERLQDWTHCHLLIGGTVHRPRRQGVIAHRTALDISCTWRVDGLPLLHPVDHLLHLRGATDDEMVEVSDGLLRRQGPLLTRARVDQRLLQLTGATGVKQVRRIQRWIRPQTDSLYETRTRMVLIRAGLPCPEVNQPVWCPMSGRTYHLDMAYPRQKIGVEYDGAVHVGDRRQMEIDAARRRDLQDEGWMIITVTASQLRDPRRLAQSVEAALVVRRRTSRI